MSHLDYTIKSKKGQHLRYEERQNENCNIKCHQSSEGRFSESDASKGESQSSFFIG